LSAEEIRGIGEIAQRNNARDGITGVLICCSGVFFQTIEGEDTKIEYLFEKIRKDSRHTDLLCLKTENDIPQRQYPKWSMKTQNLDENTDVLMQPIRSLFQVLAESHGVLETYTQPAVLNLINNGLNPLLIPSREINRIILFCDIVAFSNFSAVLSVSELVSLVNTYLTVCSEVIVRGNGEVTKYVGDCVMAYFNYDNPDAAIQAGMNILGELRKLRDGAPADNPIKYLQSGIGIACGKVIEGNIGSQHKQEYTVMGDPVNQAAYLESLTRELPRSLAVSSEIRRIASENWAFVRLGEFDLKRGQAPIPVYSIDDPITLRLG
jgi:class 3 adenylate cyclase